MSIRPCGSPLRWPAARRRRLGVAGGPGDGGPAVSQRGGGALPSGWPAPRGVSSYLSYAPQKRLLQATTSVGQRRLYALCPWANAPHCLLPREYAILVAPAAGQRRLYAPCPWAHADHGLLPSENAFQAAPGVGQCRLYALCPWANVDHSHLPSGNATLTAPGVGHRLLYAPCPWANVDHSRLPSGDAIPAIPPPILGESKKQRRFFDNQKNQR